MHISARSDLQICSGKWTTSSQQASSVGMEDPSVWSAERCLVVDDHGQAELTDRSLTPAVVVLHLAMGTSCPIISSGYLRPASIERKVIKSRGGAIFRI